MLYNISLSSETMQCVVLASCIVPDEAGSFEVRLMFAAGMPEVDSEMVTVNWIVWIASRDEVILMAKAADGDMDVADGIVAHMHDVLRKLSE